MSDLPPFIPLFLGTAFFLILSFGLILVVILHNQRQTKNKLTLNAMTSQHQRALLQARVEVEELERQRIARDIHDELGPLLSLVKLELHRLKRNHPRVDELLASAVNKVREISHNMYPTLLQRLGLRAVLLELADYYATVQQIEIQFPEDHKVPEAYWLPLYRITSELLQNAVKYSQANRIAIGIQSGARGIEYEYLDNGVGFDPGQVHRGIGLESIRVRLAEFGTEYQLTTSPGAGVRLSFVLPQV